MSLFADVYLWLRGLEIVLHTRTYIIIAIIMNYYNCYYSLQLAVLATIIANYLSVICQFEILMTTVAAISGVLDFNIIRKVDLCLRRFLHKLCLVLNHVFHSPPRLLHLIVLLLIR